jgi:ABC-type multidrug transport system permease subunit
MHYSCQSRTVSNHTIKLTSTRRKQIGLSAAARKDTITGLTNRNCVCRKTVRKARDKTLAAVDNAFSQKQSEVLLHLPVTNK